MKKLFALGFLLLASPALAQNIQCPDRPIGDATNACANTRFVQSAATGSTVSTVSNIAALRAITAPTIRPNVEVTGYYLPTDGGGGFFYWDAASGATDNGGTIIQLTIGGTGRYLRQSFGQPYNVKWFGAKGDGTTDDTTAVRQALVTGTGATVYFPATSASYLVSDTIPYFTQTIITGDGSGSVVKSNATLKSIFVNSSVSNTRFQNLKIVYTGIGAAHYKAAIECATCSGLTIENVEISDFQSHGILLRDTVGSLVENVYVHDHIGTDNDSGDIALYDNSSFNTISNSRAYGGATAWHGIIIQDTTGASNPTNNKVLNNKVKTHAAYGIINYNQASAIANDWTLIDGNTVEDIQGIFLAGQFTFGMCIYAVETGGTQVTNNKVSNCNVLTVEESLGPAAISVGQDGVSLSPVLVSGNTVITSHKWGIRVGGTEPIVSGNSVEISSPAQGGIFVASNLSANISNNTVKIPTTLAAYGIYVQGVGASPNPVTVNGNTISGGNAEGLLVFAGGGFTVQGTISANQFKSSGATFTAMSLQNMSNCSIIGNNVIQSNVAMFFADNTKCVGSGNNLIGTTFGFLSAGTNTSNVFDVSNAFGTTAKMSNAVAGTTWYINTATIPTTGGWQVGDRADTTAPALGATKGWINTAAGSPGTWTQNSATTVNGQTCTIGNTCTVTAAATSITVGTTTVGSGTSNGVLTNSAGILANTAAGTNGQLFLGVTSAQPAFATMSGDATISNAGVVTFASTITAGGPIGSATVAPIITYDAKGRLTAVSSATITPAVGSITGLGAGVATALAINIGSAGAPVLFNGAGGTPSSITLTNGTGLPTTGLTGTLQAAQEPAHTGDVTNSAGSLALSIAANAVTLAKLATQATNTVLGNATSGTAVPTALTMTSCSTAASAVIWTTNTGFGCNTSITAAAVPASGLTGATLASGVTASSLTSLGTITSLTATTINAFTLGGAITAATFAVNNTGRLGVGYTTSSGGLFSRFYDMEAGVSAAGNAGFEINASTGNSANLDMGVNAARTFAISSNATGTQITQFGSVNMAFAINGGTNALVMTNTGSTILGSAALATNATDGFLYITTSPGTPTGVPTANTGRVALVYDTTNKQFWIYDGGWKQPKTPAGAALVTWQ